MGGGSGRVGSYVECVAVHDKTAKTVYCDVLACNNEGAEVQMRKYLRNKCHVEPTEYTIFVGPEQAVAIGHYRHGILTGDNQVQV